MVSGARAWSEVADAVVLSHWTIGVGSVGTGTSVIDWHTIKPKIKSVLFVLVPC